MSTIQLRDGTPLFYEFYGDRQAPPVVFLHGYACSGRDWEPIAAALADRFCCLVMDFRGHDRSGDPQDASTLDTLAADVIEVLDQLELAQVALIGHSMGGMVGLQIALQHAARLRGLVTADAFPYLQSVVDVFGSAEDPENDPYGYGSVFDHQTDELVIARIREQMTAGVKRMPQSLFQSLLDFDARPHLSTLKIPVCLLLGARRTFRPEHMPDTLARLGYNTLPGLDWQLIDSHHFVMLEQPDATISAIGDFLNQIYP